MGNCMLKESKLFHHIYFLYSDIHDLTSAYRAHQTDTTGVMHIVHISDKLSCGMKVGSSVVVGAACVVLGLWLMWS